MKTGVKGLLCPSGCCLLCLFSWVEFCKLTAVWKGVYQCSTAVAWSPSSALSLHVVSWLKMSSLGLEWMSACILPVWYVQTQLCGSRSSLVKNVLTNTIFRLPDSKSSNKTSQQSPAAWHSSISPLQVTLGHSKHRAWNCTAAMSWAPSPTRDSLTVLEDGKRLALRKHQFIQRETFYRNRSAPGLLDCLIQDGVELGKPFPR